MLEISSILIVGAGQAAVVAVASLRDLGFSGSITVVGDEPHAPYERPPLSKAVLAAENNIAEPPIHFQDVDFFARHDIDLRLGVRVVSLDAVNCRAVVSDGTHLEFDRCLLATGGKARTLPFLLPSSSVVHYLRTLDDARRLRNCVSNSKHIVIIGGGFLGLEVASTCLNLGTKVTLIESADRLLNKAVPLEFSSWLERRVTKMGAALQLGQGVQKVDLPNGPTRQTKVELTNGMVLHADAIVVAVGLIPNHELARDAGLILDKENGGVVVDEQCATSVSGVYAAGDCASQKRKGHSAALRLESWQNANEQARIAAAAMLAQSTAPAAFPWFWTDQFGCNIQMLGLPQGGLEYIVRGNADARIEQPKFVMLGLDKENKPCHALAVNAGADLRAIRPLLEKAIAIDINKFVDTSVTLRAFAKAAMGAAKNER